MKKVILTGFSLMAFAAASFAQTNTATLNQVGSSQNSTQNQSGNNLTSTVTQGNSAVADNKGNTSFTDQRTTNNTTTVTQTTSQYNQALVFQNTGSAKASGGAQNEATIQQIESGTTALFSNPNTTPAAGGTGTGNVARIGQEDAGNHASVQQNGAGDGTNYSNYGRIDQFHGRNGATVNDVYIHQNGASHGNVASISEMQSGAKTATIEQNGQGVAGAASSNNTASINQSSLIDGVVASIQQNAGAGDDGGNGNSIGNTATVNQTGGNGSAAIQQNNGSGYGGANTATVNQSAGTHTALITQSDDSQRNKATITQDGSGSDDAQILQTGFSGDGTATINQGAGNSGTNTAYINMKNQTGAASDVTINQNTGSGTGSGNVARVYQGFDDAAELSMGISSKNHASIDQEGSTNTVNQYQVGVNNKSDITQTGTGNVVAGTSSFSRAPSFAAQFGTDNILKIDQMATGTTGANTANVYQSGMGNTGTVTQTNQ